MPEESINTTTLIELLRKMGHDMRAPLGSVISTADMLADGIYDPLTAKQVRANERIRRNSRRVLAILDDFVTYVKADAGQIQLNPGAFDPRKELSECVEQVRSLAEEKGLVLHLTTQEQVPSSLVGDIALIKRVTLHLLWNAVIFTAQGDIRIESEWSDTHNWNISVRDSGAGIPGEHVAHIFEPFWRGEERPQVSTAGVGLGLAVSLSLAKLMKGQLVLEQTGAQGSSFRLSIPLELAGNQTTVTT